MKLTKHEIDDLIDRLQKGENLPDDYKYKLFPVKQKEYELVYGGKMRREDILANEDGVFPVPLQVEKIFNGHREQWKDGWRNIIAFGDNLQFLKTIYENKDPLIKNKIKGKVKLIYIDPPFASEEDFKNRGGNKAYNDKTKGAEFVEFLRRRLIVAKQILSEDGAIYVHLDTKKSHYLKVVLDEVFGENNFLNEIIWKRTSAHSDSNNYGRIHDVILFYRKGTSNIWNKQFSKFSDNYLATHYKYKEKDGRRYDTIAMHAAGGSQTKKIFKGKKLSPPPGTHWRFTQEKINELEKEGKLVYGKNEYPRWKKYLDETEGVAAQSIFDDINPVNSGSTEKIDYPTQKPEALIERIIKSSTHSGDIVLDFFAGSGTTAATAEKLNRKWITCDIGKLAFYTMQKRLLNIESSKSIENPKEPYGKPAKSFFSVNTGHYDLAKIFELKQQEYSEFVMNLFEVEHKNKTISGIQFDGEKKDGYNVIVWQYWKLKDSLVDEDYLHDLHSHIGTKAGTRVYIIAPASYVDFISDYCEIDKVRYYFLKVPYHIIRELHRVQFKKFRQPQSKSNVNDLEDAIGFHFMRQPEVKSEWKEKGGEYYITIKKFLSVFSEEETERDMENFESLAMVLIDKNFDGETFDMDTYYFAEDLLPKKEKKSTEEDGSENIIEELKRINQIMLPPIPKKECGKKLMVIYVDIYGNDFKEEFKFK